MSQARGNWPPLLTRTAWAAKRDKAFWRGSSTGWPAGVLGSSGPTAGPWNASNWRDMPRYKLVKACTARPALCDAQLTSFVQLEPEAETGLRAEVGKHPRTPFSKSFQYRYVVVVDGNTATAARTKDSLLRNSLLLWQQTEFQVRTCVCECVRGWGDGGTARLGRADEVGGGVCGGGGAEVPLAPIAAPSLVCAPAPSSMALHCPPTRAQEFWYTGLRPYVHYLPLSEGLEDLHARIEWAQRNQGARAVGARGGGGRRGGSPRAACRPLHQWNTTCQPHPPLVLSAAPPPAAAAQEMVRAAQVYGRQHFHSEAVVRYVAVLLREYGKLMRYTPEPDAVYRRGHVHASPTQLRDLIWRTGLGACPRWRN